MRMLRACAMSFLTTEFLGMYNPNNSRKMIGVLLIVISTLGLNLGPIQAVSTPIGANNSTNQNGSVAHTVSTSPSISSPSTSSPTITTVSAYATPQPDRCTSLNLEFSWTL